MNSLEGCSRRSVYVAILPTCCLFTSKLSLSETMSSSFFIRGKSNQKENKSKRKKGLVHTDQNAKKKKKSKSSVANFNNEEISSEGEEFLENQHLPAVETDEEELMTAQEKKLKLAKKYLKEIVEEEKERNELEEVDNEVILGRLKEDVLTQAGKLRKKVGDKIRLDYQSEQLTILKCKEHKLPITCLAISNDNFLYSGSKDCNIVKWCLKTMKKVAFIPSKHKDKTNNENSHDTTILSLAVSYDNKYLASSDEGMAIRMWDTKSLVHLFSFKGHRSGVTGLQFCRFTQNLYSCSRDRTVKVWSVPERAYIETLFGHQSPVTDLDVLSKNRVVTSGGVDASLRVWKIDEESQLIYNGHEKSIDCVRRLDDHHFVSAGDDGSLCLWGVLKKKPLFVKTQAHGVEECEEPFWLTSIGCISNTEVLASGSYDGGIKLWKCDDNYRGASVLTTIPLKGFINAISFTPDMKYLVAGVGQEHKLGRWSRIKDAKNAIYMVNILKPD